MLTKGQLSPEQVRVANHQKKPDNHLVINSVPGSGKSSMLEYIAREMSDSERNESGYIAYNKGTAELFNSRMGSEFARTSNSLGYRCLRKNLKVRDQRTWVKFDKYRRIAEDILDSGDFSCDTKDERNWIDSAVKLCDLSRLNLIDPLEKTYITELLEDHGIECPFGNDEASVIVTRMMNKGKRLKESEIDFIDQVWLPHVLDLQPEKYKRLLIDEVQDTSYAARSLLLKAGEGGHITAVGDPRQAIYHWAGAPSEGMSEITNLLKADEESLPECFRCPTSHCDIAKEFAPEIRPSKNSMKGKIIQLPEREIYKSFTWESGDLFLCRTKKPLIEMGLRLMKMGIPIKMKDRGFDSDLKSLVDTISKKCGGEFDKFYDELNKHRNLMVALHFKTHTSDTTINAIQDKYNCLEVLYEYVWEQDKKSITSIKQQITQMFEATGDRVILSTLHSAKGDEASRVIILQPGKQGIKKSYKDKQQENNLTHISYTRCTKAKKGELIFLSEKKGDVVEF